MRLFLVRHGESVDNVAGLYAGSRDAPLTAHGVLQARRLGDHLAARSSALGPLRHIFSSDLQRATHTAQAIVDAQAPVATAEGDGASEKVVVVQLKDLRERDFRSSEGLKFGQVPRGGNAYNPHPDAETREEMRVRVVCFIDDHLGPALDGCGSGAGDGAADGVIVVVAHGLILNALLRALLARFGPTELARLSEGRPEYLASWSNTGYLEAAVSIVDRPPQTGNQSEDATTVSRDAGRPASSKANSEIQLTVAATNVVSHLQGLKKTRGGIGSAQFDKNQRTVDSFFGPAAKKQKKED